MNKTKIPETVPPSVVAIVERMNNGQQWQRDNAKRQLMDIRDYLNKVLKTV